MFSSCAPIDATANEGYDYDELQRLTLASRTWTGVTPDPAASTQYAYSDLGNIIKKQDYADTYLYPTPANTYAAPGPHAVTSISNAGVAKTSFTYDKNGNLTGSAGADARTVTFDNLDRPVRITLGTTVTLFR